MWLFLVSAANAPTVRRYIKNERQHHRRMTFQDELRPLLTPHGIKLDERYVGIEYVGPFQGKEEPGGHFTQGGAPRLRRYALPRADMLRPLRGKGENTTIR